MTNVLTLSQVNSELSMEGSRTVQQLKVLLIEAEVQFLRSPDLPSKGFKLLEKHF